MQRVKRGGVVVFYGAGALLYLALKAQGLLFPLLMAGAIAMALKGAALAGGRPFLAAAPGAFAFLGAALLDEAPLFSALAAAMAVGLTAEAAALVTPPVGPDREPAPER